MSAHRQSAAHTELLDTMGGGDDYRNAAMLQLQAVPDWRKTMKQKMSLAVLGLAAAGFSPFAYAVNDAAADADTVTLRMSCTQGGVNISNCFDSFDVLDNWLQTVR